MAHVNVPDHGELPGLSDDDHTQYILATGARVGASASRQTFTNGITTETIRPISDSATAFVVQNAAGTTDIISVNTSSNNTSIVGNLYLENDARIAIKDTGGTVRSMFRLNTSNQITTGTTNGTTRHYIESGGAIYFRPSSIWGRWADNGHLSVGQNATGTAWLDVAASTTGESALRLRDGVDPTSPNDGDIWNDGTDIKVRLSGVTYTLNKTSV